MPGGGRAGLGAERRAGQPDDHQQGEEQPAEHGEVVDGGHHVGLALHHPVEQRRVRLGVAAELGEGFVGGRVVEADVFAEVGVVLGGAAVPDPGGQRGGEAAAEGAQEGGQAGAIGDLVGGQVGEQDAQDRHEEERHAEPHDQLHDGDVLVVDLGGEVGAHEAGDGHRQERQAGEHAQVEMVGVAADQRREEHREDADWRGGQPGPGGGVAHLGL